MIVFVLTLGILLLVGLVLVLVVNPFKSSGRVFGRDAELDPVLGKLLKFFGDDVVSVVSEDRLRFRGRKNGLDRLFRESGNPWRLSVVEFGVLQVILGFVGLFVGLFVFVFFYSVGGVFLGLFLAPVFPVLLFNYPLSFYRGKASERERMFKAQLPEAIDYLILALSGGGYSLPVAFEEILKYMPNNLMRGELQKVVNDLHSGHTMEAALNNFADRAPTAGVKAFTKSLNNANRLSVPLIDILRARASESRKDLENDINVRIATLESRVTMIFSVTASIPLGIVVAAPALYTLLSLI